VSDPIELADHAAVDPVTGRTVMSVRVVQVDDGGAPAAKPALRLAGAAGSPVPVGTDTPIPGAPAGPPVALATRVDEGGDIQLVEIEVLQPQPKWRLQIENTDGRTHHYVVVAGSSDVETRQPWLDLPVGALAFTVRVGETAPAQELPIANHGPGPLTVTDQDGTALGSGFTLLSVTPRPVGANRSGTARIGFTTPAAPTPVAVTHTFSSNDPGAGATTGHRNRVALSAIVQPGARWFAGDVLMLNALGLGRLDRATGLPVAVTTAVTNAIDLAVDPTTGDAVVLGTDAVTRVNRSTGAQTAVPGFAEAFGITIPVGVAVERDGTLVVLFRGGGHGFVVRRPPAGPANFVVVNGNQRSVDLALDANGDAVVACGGSGVFGADAKVLRFNRSGASTTVAVGGSLSGPVGGPLAVTVESDGTILTARQFQGAGGGFTFSAGVLIRVHPQSGLQQTYVEKNVLHDPSALAVTADGTILVTGGSGLFAVDPRAGQGAEPTRLSTVSGGRVAVVPPIPG
jgi:hypothetical protein